MHARNMHRGVAVVAVPYFVVAFDRADADEAGVLPGFEGLLDRSETENEITEQNEKVCGIFCPHIKVRSSGARLPYWAVTLARSSSEAPSSASPSSLEPSEEPASSAVASEAWRSMCRWRLA